MGWRDKLEWYFRKKDEEEYAWYRQKNITHPHTYARKLKSRLIVGKSLYYICIITSGIFVARFISSGFINLNDLFYLIFFLILAILIETKFRLNEQMIDKLETKLYENYLLRKIKEEKK